MKIALLSNVIKSNPYWAAEAFLKACGDKCLFLPGKELEGIVSSDKYYSDEELFTLADVAVVFGGDGTTLTAARRAAPYNVPILSINTGHLGFLATVSASEAKKAADALLDNKLVLSERTMLNIIVERDGIPVFRSSALNDTVIHRSGGKLVDLNIKYNDTDAVEYKADGVIISTPTGSTAYSLSCGGPLVLPTVDVFIVTPICPHLLGHRPMVLPSDGRISINLSPQRPEGFISCDGQEDFAVKPGDSIIIEKSEHKAKFLTLKEYNFFRLVRKKLILND